ncbi:MAG: hypothetical protein IJN39_01575, partial [Clostridia bacterium]|nr:hypothetical protein [Clostridia bacterium]
NNPAHDNVKEWHYFVNNLVYQEANGEQIDAHMNIDVKETTDGQYFYSFAIKKGTAPQTLHAVVTESDSATVPSNDSLTQDGKTVNTNSMQNSGKDAKRQNLFTDDSAKDAGVVDSGSERGLTVNMPDNKRAKILNNRSIPIISANTEGVISLSNKEAVAKKMSEFKKDVKKVLEDAGFFKGYENAELQLEAEYTNNALNKSVHSNQYVTREDFLVLMDNFESVFENAAVIDATTDKYAGTPRANPDLETAYTLVSAFKTANGITPVQFTVKTYKPKSKEKPKLYMGIALTKITDDSFVAAPLNLEGSTATAPLSSVNISISQLVEKINPSEGHFFKHIPDSMLTAEQVASEHTAEQEDFAKYGVKPRSERQSLITESSVKELENGYIPDEEFAERARLEAAEYPEKSAETTPPPWHMTYYSTPIIISTKKPQRKFFVAFKLHYLFRYFATSAATSLVIVSTSMLL